MKDNASEMHIPKTASENRAAWVGFEHATSHVLDLHFIYCACTVHVATVPVPLHIDMYMHVHVHVHVHPMYIV